MSKMKQCKVCSKEIASNAKMCPECGAKNKKPIYKRLWFYIVIFIIIAAAVGGSKDNNTKSKSASEKEIVKVEDTSTVSKKEASKQEPVANDAPQKEAPKQEPVVNDVPTEHKSALRKAKTYSDMMHMSKAGIYDQLTSEYGEKFSNEAAQYAIDNVKADWKENALKKAETYQNTMSMSPSAIYDQLISEYGEKFTAEEAQYAIDNLK